MLFNEPKLLKSGGSAILRSYLRDGFSALQRAEIAEMMGQAMKDAGGAGFSALQRAEIAEM